MSEDLVWKALADNSRRRILDLLRVRPRTTGELADQFAMSRYGVMKHLSVLVDANLVLVRRRGRQRWNHLNAVPLQEAIERWAGPYQRSMASSLLRLRQVSESEANTMADQITDQTGSVARTMHIEQEIPVAATPKRVYDALTTRINEWWDSGFRRVENSKMYLDPRLGGIMAERNDTRQMMWATVTQLETDRLLQLTGPIGADGAVISVVTFELDAEGDGTRVRLSHHASGEVDDQMESNYTGGWQFLIGKSLVELLERD